jgi:hypothetical protein
VDFIGVGRFREDAGRGTGTLGRGRLGRGAGVVPSVVAEDINYIEVVSRLCNLLAILLSHL